MKTILYNVSCTIATRVWMILIAMDLQCDVSEHAKIPGAAAEYSIEQIAHLFVWTIPFYVHRFTFGGDNVK